MKQLIGGIAGALITGIAIFGWNGSTARDDASWSAAEAQRPLQLISDQRGTPAAVMDSESAPAALNVTCEPGQRAVIRRMPSVSGLSMEAGCVGRRRHRHPFECAAPSPRCSRCSRLMPCPWRTRGLACSRRGRCVTTTMCRHDASSRGDRGRSVRS